MPSVETGSEKSAKGSETVQYGTSGAPRTGAAERLGGLAGVVTGNLDLAAN